MRLAEAIAEVGAMPSLHPSWPNRPRVAQALDRMPLIQGDAPPPAEEARLIALRIAQAAASGAQLEPRLLRMAPWCLWGEDGLARHPGILEQVLAQILAASGSRALRNLATTYVGRSQESPDGADRVASALSVAAARAHGIGAPWDRLHADFDIFDPVGGPATIAEAAIRDSLPVEEVLSRAGLRGTDPRLPLASRAIAWALGICATAIGSDHARRLALAKMVAVGDDGALKAQSTADIFARALIEPFRGDVPDTDTVEDYRRILLGLFGDPRLPGHRWQRMPAEAAAFRRWMTRENLRQFLDVTGTVAKHMFHYREKFWWAVYETGLIQESWVVFAKKGAAVARASYGEDLPFATFRRGYDQFQSNHAVLLLRMGDCTIAEWSHDGRVTIWSHQDTPGCPRLYEQSYSAGQLRTMATNDPRTRAETFGTIHTSPERHIWQDAVAARIEHLTGVRINPSSYKVPSWPTSP